MSLFCSAGDSLAVQVQRLKEDDHRWPTVREKKVCISDSGIRRSSPKDFHNAGPGSLQFNAVKQVVFVFEQKKGKLSKLSY